MPALRPTRLRPASAALLAALAWLVADGCAPARTGARAPAPTPAAVLSTGDIRDLAMELQLEDRRLYDSTALAGLARSPTAEVRRRAYLAAGRIGDHAARPLVRAGLRDQAPDVRAAAAFALGLLRDSAAVDSLARVSLEGTAPAAAQAVFALGRIGTPAAHAAVLAVLQRVGSGATPPRSPTGAEPRDRGPDAAGPSPSAGVLGRALLTVWRFKRVPEDARVVRALASSPDTALRWRAAYALMRLGDPAAVPDLLSMIADPYPGVRELAARGLRASVVDSAGQRAAAQQALVGALADTSAHVRIQAAGALAGYRAPELVAPLARLLDDPDGNVAVAAGRALGALGQATAAEPLAAHTDRAPVAVRAAALQALVHVEPTAGLRRVSDFARDSTWRARYYAADALGAGTWAQVSGPLEALLHDPDPRVVTAALGSLQQLLGDSLAPPRALVIEQLAAPSPFVRAAAIAVLAGRHDPANLQALLDSYARAVPDSADDAAVAAVDALGALKRAGVPAAHDFFARFQRSRDPIVRQHVAAQLGPDWGPVFPVETGRDPAFYQAIVRRVVAPVLTGGPTPRVRVLTSGGDARNAPDAPGTIVLALDAAEAPLTVENFLTLVRRRYFDGDRWHRVVPDFVVQDGDPQGDGNGGPGWAIRDELSPAPYLRGTLGMALSGPDTGGSQWFIALSPQPHLDANYTIFGRVVAGWDVLDRVQQDDVIRAIQVVP